jgi:hypothetical protein
MASSGRPELTIAVCARSRLVLNTAAEAGRARIRVFTKVSELERASQPFAALVYELGCEPSANVPATGALMGALAACPVIVATSFQAGDGQLLATLCNWRSDIIIPLDWSEDLQRAITEATSGRPRVNVVAQLIAAVERPLPVKLGDYRAFDAIGSQARSRPSEAAVRCRRKCSTLARTARVHHVPGPRRLHGMHRGIIAIADVLDADMPEKQVAANRGFGSAGNLSHQVITNTGHSIHDWKLMGGVPWALRAYAALFADDADRHAD